MWKNYIVTAFRNLIRQKGYSFINIAGLAVGLACCILIMLWVQDELSYDRFNENAGQLYFVILNQSYSDGNTVVTVSTPAPLGPVLKEQYPEIVNSTRYSSYTEKLLVSYGDNHYIESVRMADNGIFEMFTFPFVKGDPATALTEPYSIVLTEEIAQKYFGDEDPLGKILQVRGEFDFKVTGVMKNIPHNSSMRPDMLVPFEFVEHLGLDLDDWGLNTYNTIVQLHESASQEEVTEKIALTIQSNSESSSLLTLHPLTRIHLYSIRGEGGDIRYVRIFSLIALFVLLIACINFMNLATARSERRAREVGMRKVVGANQWQLIRQFMGESILMSFLGLIVALLLVELLLPVFNQLADKSLSLDLLGNHTHLLGALSATLITGIVAGSYPALFLARFKPVKVLKGTTTSGLKGSRIRRWLVAVQFCLSVILIICTLVVYKQLIYMKNAELGLNTDHVIRLPIEGLRGDKFTAFKNELLRNPSIEAVSAGFHWPMYVGSNTSGWDWEGKDPDREVLMNFTFIDFDFDKTFHLKLADGRFFSEEFSSDPEQSVVVNEAAVKHTGIDDPVGKQLSVFGSDYTIVGVVKDYHCASLHREIEPMGMFIIRDWHSHIFVRLAEDDVTSALTYVEETYNRMNPGYPFQSTFLDDMYKNMYGDEQRMGNLLKYFTILAIFISCLGLFGFASFAAERRTKEIGIRKVLGATLTNILTLMSVEFVVLVSVSFIIASPIAYLAMRSWLQNFAYRTDLTIWLFLLAGLTALLITLLTISFQALKAALANPVKSLRYE